MPPYSYDPTRSNATPTPTPTPRTPYPSSSYPYPYSYVPNGYSYAPNAHKARPAAKPPAAPRMSKAEALALTRLLKRGTVGVALAAFLALAGLAGAHAVGAASASSSSTESSGGINGQQPSTQQSNPFFGSQSGGGSFGSDGSGSQAPIAGTGVS
ncbi:MAG TPA: hypothetical protein VKQ30_18755 [Ktedonobacterales bacterium]|nr:hypothetical protein [Ktedonobacterales bacterium]